MCLAAIQPSKSGLSMDKRTTWQQEESKVASQTDLPGGGPKNIWSVLIGKRKGASKHSRDTAD